MYLWMQSPPPCRPLFRPAARSRLAFVIRWPPGWACFRWASLSACSFVQAGLPWWVAPALSVAGFAGSLELLLIGMMVAVTPLATIALTTFLVNFRHVFYSFSFPLHVVKNPVAKAYSVYAMIDEAYAVTAASKENWTGWRLISMQLAFQAYWVGGGLAGVGASALLPAHVEGLEFALCALFVTLTLDAAKTRKQVPSLLLAALSLGTALVVAPGASLFVGLVIFLLLLIVRFGMDRRRGVLHA